MLIPISTLLSAKIKQEKGKTWTLMPQQIERIRKLKKENEGKTFNMKGHVVGSVKKVSGFKQNWTAINEEMIKKEKISDGLVEEFYDNGRLKRRGNRKNGKENGLWEAFYEHGQLSQRGSLIDGKQEGLFEYYYNYGQLFNRGSFKNDEQEGLWEYFDEEGSSLFSGTTSSCWYCILFWFECIR